MSLKSGEAAEDGRDGRIRLWRRRGRRRVVEVELMLNGFDGGLKVGDDCGESVAVDAKSNVAISTRSWSLRLRVSDSIWVSQRPQTAVL